ncbi:hypothetical protein BD324DRAFT_651145 [Kockovaella imperatae]|uniref:Uncharacterized protein n=1 Tax=Kockovaella imperatae TaxID=4999 RepID=A0A1Y1UF98_9TREE|nr:hypothetical protein BD324DRAFT_651145 [Kockovaella imperatae]ORX36659.1 hypothetical protein BD324DRAFT_651145 [Kockovaella imperatae]
MTLSASRASPIALPISALLPSSANAPPDPLPFPHAAILGPLPPTAALHLALEYLALAEIPAYDGQQWRENGDDCTSEASYAASAPARALIINCAKTWAEDIEEEDEDWLRDHGAEYGVLDMLSRVDMRFCPSPKHLILLLNLLSTTSSSPASGLAHELPTTPGLVILQDAASMFMRTVEQDENLPPAVDETDEPRLRASGVEFEPGTTISDYLDLISCAKNTLHHFASTSGDGIPPQLVVLEPHLSSTDSYLPILKPAASLDQKGKMATPTREKRINVKDALEYLIGQPNVGVVEQEGKLRLTPDPDATPDDPPLYSLTLRDEASYRMTKRHCQRHSWARATPVNEESEMVQEDPGGWRWEWTV